MAKIGVESESEGESSFVPAKDCPTPDTCQGMGLCQGGHVLNQEADYLRRGMGSSLQYHLSLRPTCSHRQYKEARKSGQSLINTEEAQKVSGGGQAGQS